MPVIHSSDLPVFCRALAGARFGAPEQTAQRLLSATGSICPADAAVLVTAVLDARTADALITLRASGASVFLLFCSPDGTTPDGLLAARLQAAGVALIAAGEKEAAQQRKVLDAICRDANKAGDVVVAWTSADRLLNPD